MPLSLSNAALPGRTRVTVLESAGPGAAPARSAVVVYTLQRQLNSSGRRRHTAAPPAPPARGAGSATVTTLAVARGAGGATALGARRILWVQARVPSTSHVPGTARGPRARRAGGGRLAPPRAGVGAGWGRVAVPPAACASESVRVSDGRRGGHVERRRGELPGNPMHSRRRRSR
jgi:hypothetical protein